MFLPDLRRGYEDNGMMVIFVIVCSISGITFGFCLGFLAAKTHSPQPDGTLTVFVEKGAKVGRVLVWEEGTDNGGLYYPEE